ncbi:hypothetical protein PHYSODRAFT_338870 [Phytophthora sojae]|uniref:Uncharacterized protein n=1 Tax=Phytophthora sojae (strain P6497) TaxID=1094619 RepID=G5A3I5_PHYSP|nr:hypothetical protein PHYSODRAFT_338870 [Phytophthora sojae]EGZ10201.1 hypothetical protein PHYSODRAFT_338870 [Phytophthora sojae]|eukprot:XP_009535062.1 hypothetical protein PHYSODRAFT_338870 [Phytophthora sojae]
MLASSIVGAQSVSSEKQVQQRGQEQLDAVREEQDRVRESTFDWAVLLDVLSHLVVHSLLGSFHAFAPLSQRLSAETQQSMDAIFGDQYRAVLQRGELLEIDEAALQPNSRFRSWAAMVEWSNVRPIENTRQDVRQPRMKTVSARLKTSRVTRPQERALEQEKSQLKNELELLEGEDALLIRNL